PPPPTAPPSGSSSRRIASPTAASSGRPRATWSASAPMRRTSVARSPGPIGVSTRALGQINAVAGVLDDGMVGVGDQDAHLLRGGGTVADLVAGERNGSGVQEPRPV